MQPHEHPHEGETMRQAVQQIPGEAPTTRDLLNFAEAAAFLGFKKSYLYKLTSSRQIPFFKYGGRLVLFDRAALEAWKSSKLVAMPTQAEARARAAADCAANPSKR